MCGREPPGRRRNGQVAALSLLSILLATFGRPPPANAEHFYSENFHRRTNIKSAVFHSPMLNREVRYSIYLPPTYFDDPARKFPIIYYFHGLDTKGLAYKDWLNWHLDEALDDLIAANQAQEMIVAMPECFSTGIVVNWGRPPKPLLPPALTLPFRFLRGVFRSINEPTYFGTYLFLHRWDLARAEYADFFTEEFISHIEDNYRVKRGRNFRAVCGFSMGGYSALSVAFQNPHLFDSVSAHAPMLVSGSPFSAGAKDLFVEFDPKRNRFVAQRFTINLLRRIFSDQETWKANNPMNLARSTIPDALSVYIDVADGDKRKCDLGAKELVAALRSHGTTVEFKLVEGLPSTSSHTYPGFVNGKLVAKHAQGKSETELHREYGWKNLRLLINPRVQRIRHSLIFHSKEFRDE